MNHKLILHISFISFFIMLHLIHFLILFPSIRVHLSELTLPNLRERVVTFRWLFLSRISWVMIRIGIIIRVWTKCLAVCRIIQPIRASASFFTIIKLHSLEQLSVYFLVHWWSVLLVYICALIIRLKWIWVGWIIVQIGIKLLFYALISTHLN